MDILSGIDLNQVLIVLVVLFLGLALVKVFQTFAGGAAEAKRQRAANEEEEFNFAQEWKGSGGEASVKIKGHGPKTAPLTAQGVLARLTNKLGQMPPAEMVFREPVAKGEPSGSPRRRGLFR